MRAWKHVFTFRQKTRVVLGLYRSIIFPSCGHDTAQNSWDGRKSDEVLRWFPMPSGLQGAENFWTLESTEKKLQFSMVKQLLPGALKSLVVFGASRIDHFLARWTATILCIFHEEPLMEMVMQTITRWPLKVVTFGTSIAIIHTAKSHVFIWISTNEVTA